MIVLISSGRSRNWYRRGALAAETAAAGGDSRRKLIHADVEASAKRWLDGRHRPGRTPRAAHGDRFIERGCREASGDTRANPARANWPGVATSSASAIALGLRPRPGAQRWIPGGVVYSRGLSRRSFTPRSSRSGGSPGSGVSQYRSRNRIPRDQHSRMRRQWRACRRRSGRRSGASNCCARAGRGGATCFSSGWPEIVVGDRRCQRPGAALPENWRFQCIGAKSWRQGLVGVTRTARSVTVWRIAVVGS